MRQESPEFIDPFRVRATFTSNSIAHSHYRDNNQLMVNQNTEEKRDNDTLHLKRKYNPTPQTTVRYPR